MVSFGSLPLFFYAILGGLAVSAASRCGTGGGSNNSVSCKVVAPGVVEFAAFNGQKSNEYEFMRATLSSRSGSYSALMVEQCKKIGMKPVCDHPSYCKDDINSLYIGQKQNIAYGYYRRC